MSVPPGDRKPSNVQFLATAEEIESRAMDVCRKWPKSWMFVLTTRTLALASRIHEKAQDANAIFPITTEREKQDRISNLQQALGATYGFAKKMELAFRKFPICGEKKDMSPEAAQEKSGKILEEFMILCAEEKASLSENIRYVRAIELDAKDVGDEPAEETK